MRLFTSYTNRQQYVRTLIWLLDDTLWRVKWKLMVAIVPGAVGMSLQVSAVGLILYFAKMLVEGETFSRFGMEISPTESYAFTFIHPPVLEYYDP